MLLFFFRESKKKLKTFSEIHGFKMTGEWRISAIFFHLLLQKRESVINLKLEIFNFLIKYIICIF